MKGKGTANNMFIKTFFTTLLLFAAAGSTGCSQTASHTHSQEHVRENYVRHVPGAVEYIWEEPMVNVVDIPPGLDPEGHYYRPAHQSIVEIRQGRWQYYRE
jgi:hypothetical protein